MNRFAPGRVRYYAQTKFFSDRSAQRAQANQKENAGVFGQAGAKAREGLAELVFDGLRGKPELVSDFVGRLVFEPAQAENKLAPRRQVRQEVVKVLGQVAGEYPGFSLVIERNFPGDAGGIRVSDGLPTDSIQQFVAEGRVQVRCGERRRIELFPALPEVGEDILEQVFRLGGIAGTFQCHPVQGPPVPAVQQRESSGVTLLNGLNKRVIVK